MREDFNSEGGRVGGRESGFNNPALGMLVPERLQSVLGGPGDSHFHYKGSAESLQHFRVVGVFFSPA